MMKARQYNRRILTEGISPNLVAVQRPGKISSGALKRLGDLEPLGKRLLDTFAEAEEFGSILNVEFTERGLNALDARLDELSEKALFANLLDAAEMNECVFALEPMLKQARILGRKYHVTVTNPPYMAPTAKQKPFLEKNYPASKADLFAMFIEKCGQMLVPNGYQAMITMHSWMFLSSYEKLRLKLQQSTIVNMAHLGARAFEEIGGEVVQTTAFVLGRKHIAEYKGVYCRLIEPTSQVGKEEMFLAGEKRYVAEQGNFAKIPGEPVAYWVSAQAINCYIMMEKTGNHGDGRIGLITGDADRFLRLWNEVYLNRIGFEIRSNEESIRSGCRWFPTQKGGEFRRWYGNTVYVVNWENDGYEMKFDNFMGNRVRSHNYNGEYGFKKAITWTTISTSNFACRYSGDGFIYDTAGPFIHLNKESEIAPMLAFLNSAVADFYLKIMNPTINFPPGYIQSIPFSEDIISKNIEDVSIECVTLSKTDWDSYETSWDFKRNPLV